METCVRESATEENATDQLKYQLKQTNIQEEHWDSLAETETGGGQQQHRVWFFLETITRRSNQRRLNYNVFGPT